nr:organic cation/carnitine transporter 3-like [Ipomoea batatas]
MDSSMADSKTPLLTETPVFQDSDHPRLQPLPKPDFWSIEEMIEPLMSGFGWYQLLQVILVSMASFFEGQQTFITIFTDATPSWHCTDSFCNSQSDICELPTNSWSWDKPSHTSIISEWSLYCSQSSVITGLPSSSFFLGSFLGGIVLTLIGDSFGRKTVLSLSCFTMSLASVFSAFSANIWVYSGLRLVSGLGKAAIGSCVLVLSRESVGKQWESQVGTLGFLCSTLGFLSLPGIAYLTQGYSWRVLYLATSLPAVIYSLILVQFCVYESPRWLLAQGRVDEAEDVLNRFSDNPNSSNLDLSEVLLIMKDNQNPKSTKTPQSAVKILLQKGWFFRQLVLAMLPGFGIGMIYYGMPLGIGNLDIDLYLSSALNACLEIPSTLIIYFFVDKWKRRMTLLGLSTTSGVSGMLCIVLSEWKAAECAVELVSLFAACTAFSLLLIFTAELFPVSIRNSALSAVWLAVVLGGVVSPVLLASTDEKNKVWSYVVLGVLAVVLGSAVIWLPETMGSIEEEEGKDDQIV